jgi:hypothetical protein
VSKVKSVNNIGQNEVKFLTVHAADAGEEGGGVLSLGGGCGENSLAATGDGCKAGKCHDEAPVWLL